MERRFILNKSNAKLMGVAAGTADYLRVDPLFVRLAIIMAVLLTGPVAAFLYLATGFLAADR